MSTPEPVVDVAVIGTGIVGIATAWSLATRHGITRIALIDAGEPMAFTSAQSGENYRNWWPQPAMAALADRSTNLMEEISRETDDRIRLSRRGYLLATRQGDIDSVVAPFHVTGDEVRVHTVGRAATYRPAASPNWRCAPDGVDVLLGQALVHDTFPYLDPAVRAVVHVRRAGDLDSQQLGSYMLEVCRAHGAQRWRGEVIDIERRDRYAIRVQGPHGSFRIACEAVVNAAGPFAGDVARMLDVSLPLLNTFQQKIAFEDTRRRVRRDMPFAIDLDPQRLAWSDEERELLLDDEDYRWLVEDMPGAIHCRPDGGDRGSWLKLGWAYNDRREPASRELPLFEHFPDVVLRGATRLLPALGVYHGRLPRARHHYGGWYTRTDENWPLIGPMGPPGAFMNCAHSGFGTMMACAAGELCASWVAGASLPEHAREFSLARHDDAELMKTLRQGSKGLL